MFKEANVVCCMCASIGSLYRVVWYKQDRVEGKHGQTGANRGKQGRTEREGEVDSTGQTEREGEVDSTGQTEREGEVDRGT